MFLDTLASFSVLIILAFCLYKYFGTNPSLTPFIALCGVISFVSFASLVNLLIPAVWLVYIFAAVLLAAALKNSKDIKGDIQNFFTPGVIFFCAASVMLFVALVYHKPNISLWDEFSFWGTSQKLTKNYGAIYTFYNSSLIGKTTPPALAVLSTFFQPVGSVYYEWKAFFAYDMLLLSAFAAWTAAFKKDRWNFAFLVFLFGFMTPYVFEVYTKIVYLAPMYISIMADIPLGVTFGAAVSVYLFGKNKNHNYILWLIPVLTAFTLMKDMGFAFSLIVIFIIFSDMVLTQKEFDFLKIKGFLGKAASCVFMAAGVITAFMAWTIHMRLVLKADRFQLGGEAQMGMAQMVITGIKQLFSPVKEQKFTDMERDMIKALFNRNVSMFGNGIRTILVITAVFAAAVILAKRKEDIKRIISLYVTGGIGFVSYYVFHIFIYTYIFKANAYGLPSYERYVYPYYIAWLAFGVMSLCIAVLNPRQKLLANLALYGFVICLFGLFKYMVNYQNTFVLYNGDRDSLRQNIIQSAQSIEDAVGKEDVIYCYSNREDAGQRWFLYTYELVPNVIIDDVPWFDSSNMTQEEITAYWRRSMLEHMKNKGATHFLVDWGSDELQLAFGKELGIDTRTIGLYDVAYYKIVNIQPEKDIIEFEPVKMGQVAH